MEVKNINGKRLTKEEKEMQLLLDSMLVPFSDYRKNLAANRKLEPLDEDKKLLKIVLDLERLKKDDNKDDKKENISKRLDIALEDIAKMMNMYGGDKNNVGYASGQPHKRVLPFLVQQVLFYIAALCIEDYNGEQNVVIQELRKLGVTISHNFFSRKRTTPKQYVDMKRYTQPELPANYVGQKREDLAVAIKNLVYQSGKYDVFCDIFGGSGAASLAVNRRKEANYVYNELNRRVHNLFFVLADDKMHKELIEELELLQKDLKGDGVWLDANDCDFYKEIQLFFSKRCGNRTYDERKVKEDGPQDLDIEYETIVYYMQIFRQGIIDQNNGFIFDFDGISYDKNRLLCEVFPAATDNSHMSGFACFMSFCQNYRLIKAMEDVVWLDLISGKYTSGIDQTTQKEGILFAERRHMQFRFYKYYAYFSNLLNKPGEISSEDRVRYAVAENICTVS